MVFADQSDDAGSGAVRRGVVRRGVVRWGAGRGGVVLDAVMRCRAVSENVTLSRFPGAVADALPTGPFDRTFGRTFDRTFDQTINRTFGGTCCIFHQGCLHKRVYELESRLRTCAFLFGTSQRAVLLFVILLLVVVEVQKA